MRKIIHIDMDAFYASVEQADNPELKGLPVAVGGDSSRGVVAAASYQARRYGIRSAMSSVVAKKICPDLIFVPPRFDRYREVSQQIRNIFQQYTDLVEPLSLDEAYLDVTQNKVGNPSASLIAREIRQRILQETGLTASAGISINKFIAKIASDVHKPNGQKTVPPEEISDFLEQLDIRKFYGVGRVTAEKMYRLGIFTGKDLKSKNLTFLQEHFGSSGEFFFDVVRGVHRSEVTPRRISKSIGAERTFEKNISSEIFLREKLQPIASEIEKRLLRKSTGGRTVTLKIKYSDFSTQTRSKTLDHYSNSGSEILEIATSLLYQEQLKESVRLIGISLSNLKGSKEKDPDSEVLVQLKLQF